MRHNTGQFTDSDYNNMRTNLATMQFPATGAPTFAPRSPGDYFYDSANNKAYLALGTTWIPLN
jgi:hypothetical protein